MLARRDALRRVRLVPHQDLDQWQRRCDELGLRIYAADRFNFALRAMGTVSQGERRAFVETFGAGPQHALA